MSFAIEPKSRGDEDKIVSSIHRLTEEDPTLNFRREEQTKEMILSGMGQIHIEVAVEKMKRKFGVEVNLKIPKVPTRRQSKVKRTFRAATRSSLAAGDSLGIAGLILNPSPGWRI